MHPRLLPIRWFLILLLSTIAAGSCTEYRPKPNIVVIVIDALRKDHLGAYGYIRDTSPRFDSFAESNTLFQRATANCPWTSPSVVSLFTGLYPSVHGTVEHFGNTANSLDGGLATLAGILGENGYQTAGFVANAWLDPGLGFDSGFDYYDQINSRRKPRADEVNAKVMTWFDDREDGPFFLYVHYMDVHGPYRAPAPFDQAFQSQEVRKLSIAERKNLGYLKADFTLDRNELNYYRDQYDGEILYTDGHLGQLIDALDNRGFLDDTIVVITSDHGEAFLEHGNWDHGNSVYEEEIAIPLAINFPAWVTAKYGASIAAAAEAPMELTDLAPTLLGLVGTRFPYRVNGRDLLATDPGLLASHPVCSEELAARFKGDPKLAWRIGDLKAHFDPGTGRLIRLYDLAEDPGETVDLADVPGRTKEIAALEAAILNHLLAASRLRAELEITADAVPLDPALRRKLESLGYTR